MSSFPFKLSINIHLIYSILISLCSSQTTICVWNSVGILDHYNGEYTISTPNISYNKPYWTKSSSTCPSSTYYMMYVNDGWGDFWMLDDYLHASYVDNHPYCEEPTPSNPALCSAGWYEWTKNNKAIPLSTTVTDGSCPSLQCKKMKLSNTNDIKCNDIFSRDVSNENVFINTATATYVYFNKNTFKWYCSATLLHEECDNDADITDFYVSSNKDGWNDVNIGESFQTQLNNGYTATFECIGPTSAPTTDPTKHPTKTPTNNPTPSPTSVPTQYPTKTPTINPTPSPTSVPTGNPSKTPTNTPTYNPSSNPTTPIPTDSTWSPTTAPTDEPTIDPTNNPTKGPTNAPTSHPTSDPTKAPTSDPSVVPTRAPTKVPSMNPTTQKIVVIVDGTWTTKATENENVVSDDNGDGNDIENDAGNTKQGGGGGSFFDNMMMIYIIGGAFLLVILLTICMFFMYCRERKRGGKKTNDIRHIPSKSSMEMTTSKNSINLGEFCAATTPNLAAISNTMGGPTTGGPATGGMKELELMHDHNTKGMDAVKEILDRMGGTLQQQMMPKMPNEITLYGAVRSVSEYGAGSPVVDDEENNKDIEEGDGTGNGTSDDGDELYEVGLARMVTAGGPSGDNDVSQMVTRGGSIDLNEDEQNEDEFVEDNHEEMYVKPHNNIITVGI